MIKKGVRISYNPFSRVTIHHSGNHFSITLKINQNDTTIRPYQSIETDDTSGH
jgi:hypothetical protein